MNQQIKSEVQSPPVVGVNQTNNNMNNNMAVMDHQQQAQSFIGHPATSYQQQQQMQNGYSMPQQAAYNMQNWSCAGQQTLHQQQQYSVGLQQNQFLRPQPAAQQMMLSHSNTGQHMVYRNHQFVGGYSNPTAASAAGVVYNTGGNQLVQQGYGSTGLYRQQQAYQHQQLQYAAAGNAGQFTMMQYNNASTNPNYFQRWFLV